MKLKIFRIQNVEEDFPQFSLQQSDAELKPSPKTNNDLELTRNGKENKVQSPTKPSSTRSAVRLAVKQLKFTDSDASESLKSKDKGSESRKPRKQVFPVEIHEIGPEIEEEKYFKKSPTAHNSNSGKDGSNTKSKSRRSSALNNIDSDGFKHSPKRKSKVSFTKLDDSSESDEEKVVSAKKKRSSLKETKTAKGSAEKRNKSDDAELVKVKSASSIPKESRESANGDIEIHSKRTPTSKSLKSKKLTESATKKGAHVEDSSTPQKPLSGKKNIDSKSKKNTAFNNVDSDNDTNVFKPSPGGKSRSNEAKEERPVLGKRRRSSSIEPSVSKKVKRGSFKELESGETIGSSKKTVSAETSESDDSDSDIEVLKSLKKSGVRTSGMYRKTPESASSSCSKLKLNSSSRDSEERKSRKQLFPNGTNQKDGKMEESVNGSPQSIADLNHVRVSMRGKSRISLKFKELDNSDDKEENVNNSAKKTKNILGKRSRVTSSESPVSKKKKVRSFAETDEGSIKGSAKKTKETNESDESDSSSEVFESLKMNGVRLSIPAKRLSDRGDESRKFTKNEQDNPEELNTSERGAVTRSKNRLSKSPYTSMSPSSRRRSTRAGSHESNSSDDMSKMNKKNVQNEDIIQSPNLRKSRRKLSAEIGKMESIKEKNEEDSVKMSFYDKLESLIKRTPSKAHKEDVFEEKIKLGKSDNPDSDYCPRTPKSRKSEIKKKREAPVTPTTKIIKKVETPRTPLEEARLHLHVAAVPDILPCREEEFMNVYNFMENKLLDGIGGCMYVSGVPGTGKTATVTSAVRRLQGCAKEGKVPPFNYVEINGMRLSDPRQAYVLLWKSLSKGKERISADYAQKKLDAWFNSNDSKKMRTVVLVDELDLMCTRKQDVVYNLLDWPSKPKSKLVVITIANTMDMPERKLKGRVNSRLGLTRLTFHPYTHKQLEEIVLARLQGNDSFVPDAIRLATRKVAAVSGDARRALDICRRATELPAPDEPVRIKHIEMAIKQMTNSNIVKFIRSCSEYEKLFLKCISDIGVRTGIEEVDYLQVYDHLLSLCTLEGLERPPSTAVLTICSRLRCFRLLFSNDHRVGVMQRLTLNVTQDDLHYALKVDE